MNYNDSRELSIMRSQVRSRPKSLAHPDGTMSVTTLDSDISITQLGVDIAKRKPSIIFAYDRVSRDRHIDRRKTFSDL